MFKLWLYCLAIFSSLQTHSQTILFLGDSLTAGYGVLKNESYPSLVEQKLKEKFPELKVINGAESGSLSSSLTSRLEFYLKKIKPQVVIIASGGNDGRQLTPAKVIQTNLKSAVVLAKQKKIKVVLVGMQIFPNLGKEYRESFARVYPDLAAETKVTLVPFLLEGVYGDSKLNQSDGFHPNALGHKKMAELITPYIEKLL